MQRECWQFRIRVSMGRKRVVRRLVALAMTTTMGCGHLIGLHREQINTTSLQSLGLTRPLMFRGLDKKQIAALTASALT